MDRGFRYGDALIYLLPETPVASLEAVLEKVRRGYLESLSEAGLPAPTPTLEVGFCSIAFGAPKADTTPEMILEKLATLRFLL